MILKLIQTLTLERLHAGGFKKKPLVKLKAILNQVYNDLPEKKNHQNEHATGLSCKSSDGIVRRKYYYHSMHFFLLFIGQEPTT